MQDGLNLDPQVRAVLDEAVASGAIPLHRLSPEQARAAYRKSASGFAQNSPDIKFIGDSAFERDGSSIPYRLYSDDIEATEKAMLIYFHGGGWSFGDIESYDHVCRWLCHYSGATVMSVDYRLAPEHKFPAAVEDAIFVLGEVFANCCAFGVRANAICVGGDSAGAALATVTAMHWSNIRSNAICAQALIYPATDMSMSSPSHQQFGEGLRLTQPLLVWSALNYLRDGNDIHDWRASPLHAEHCGNLPPALIVTAEFDPLRDEGAAYARKLEAAGNSIEYFCAPGMVHGFIGMTGRVDAADACLKKIGRYIARFAPDTNDQRQI